MAPCKAAFLHRNKGQSRAQKVYEKTGRDLSATQHAMGHKSPASTAAYLPGEFARHGSRPSESDAVTRGNIMGETLR